MSRAIDEVDKENSRLESPRDALEKLYIAAYLESRGHSFETLQRLPENEARALKIQALIYASTKLAEVEARAGLVKAL